MISIHKRPLQLYALITLLLLATFTINATHASQQNNGTEQTDQGIISGKVSDVLTASGIVYVEIDTGAEKVWAAGPSVTPPAKGDTVSFMPEMVMQNYHSKYLDREFSVIYFIKQFNRDTEDETVMAQNQASKPKITSPAIRQSTDKPVAIGIGGYLREAELDGLNTENRELSSFKGKPLVINIWASWCVPCRAEMNSLEQLARRFNGTEFNIIGISIDDYRDKAVTFIQQTGIRFENFQDHNLIMEKMLGATTIPLTVLIDAEGRIIHKVDGARQWDSPEIIAAIAKAFRLKLAKQ